MSEIEMTREQMEEALMNDEFPQEETIEAPEVAAEPSAEEEKPPEQPEISIEELKSRFAKMEEELSHKTGALAEEREKRRERDNQYNLMFEAIQQARERKVQEQQYQVPADDGDYSEYSEFFNAWEKKYGAGLGQAIQRLSQLEEMFQANYAIQEQTRTFAQKSQAFASTAADYDNAMQFLVDRVRQEADLFITDPNQKQQYIQSKAQQMIYYDPEKLYAYAKLQGYVGQEPTKETPTTNAPLQVVDKAKPKSLASVSGATGTMPDSWQSKAHKVVGASMEELEKIPLAELDNLLKQMK